MTWFKEKSSKPYASTRKVNVRICHNFLPVQYTSEPTQFKGLNFNELKLTPPPFFSAMLHSVTRGDIQK